MLKIGKPQEDINFGEAGAYYARRTTRRAGRGEGKGSEKSEHHDRRHGKPKGRNSRSNLKPARAGEIQAGPSDGEFHSPRACREIS